MRVYNVCHSDTLSMLKQHCSNFKIVQVSDFYTPPHNKWRGIMLYPPNFECPSVRPSVCPSALRFRALTLVPFDLFSSNFA